MRLNLNEVCKILSESGQNNQEIANFLIGQTVFVTDNSNDHSYPVGVPITIDGHINVITDGGRRNPYFRFQQLITGGNTIYADEVDLYPSIEVLMYFEEALRNIEMILRRDQLILADIKLFLESRFENDKIQATDDVLFEYRKYRLAKFVDKYNNKDEILNAISNDDQLAIILGQLGPKIISGVNFPLPQSMRKLIVKPQRSHRRSPFDEYRLKERKSRVSTTKSKATPYTTNFASKVTPNYDELEILFGSEGDKVYASEERIPIQV